MGRSEDKSRGQISQASVSSVKITLDSGEDGGGGGQCLKERTAHRREIGNCSPLPVQGVQYALGPESVSQAVGPVQPASLHLLPIPYGTPDAH